MENSIYPFVITTTFDYNICTCNNTTVNTEKHKRVYRELSQETKDKISKSLKLNHAKRTEKQKNVIRSKQAKTMRAYWETIPTTN